MKDLYYVYTLHDTRTGSVYYVGTSKMPIPITRRGIVTLQGHQGDPAARKRTARIRERHSDCCPEVKIDAASLTRTEAVALRKELRKKHARTIAK